MYLGHTSERPDGKNTVSRSNDTSRRKNGFWSRSDDILSKLRWTQHTPVQLRSRKLHAGWAALRPGDVNHRGALFATETARVILGQGLNVNHPRRGRQDRSPRRNVVTRVGARSFLNELSWFYSGFIIAVSKLIIDDISLCLHFLGMV